MVTKKVALDSGVMLGQCDEHGQCALAVTDVMNLFACFCSYIDEGCREVVLSHLVESEIPEVFYFWTHALVAVSVASTVPQPNIKPQISQIESRCKMFIINNPSITGINQSMLQINYSFAYGDLCIFGYLSCMLYLGCDSIASCKNLWCARYGLRRGSRTMCSTRRIVSGFIAFGMKLERLRG